MHATLGLSGTQLLLGIIGSGGALGSIIAFFKLRPDANTAAVAQSKGAVESMAVLQDALMRDRDEWRERAIIAEGELKRVRHELEQCQKAHGRRQADHTGAKRRE